MIPDPYTGFVSFVHAVFNVTTALIVGAILAGIVLTVESLRIATDPSRRLPRGSRGPLLSLLAVTLCGVTVGLCLLTHIDPPVQHFLVWLATVAALAGIGSPLAHLGVHLGLRTAPHTDSPSGHPAIEDIPHDPRP